MPEGAAAIRSGTNSCRGGAPADPGAFRDDGTALGAAATPGGGATVKPYELPDGPGPAETTLAGTTLARAGTANAASAAQVAAPATAARQRDGNNTMSMKI